MKWSPWLSSCALAALVSAPAVEAQNMVSNAGFDANFVGWIPGSSPAQLLPGWSPADAAGQPGSGSAVVDNVSPGINQGVTLEQCLPVVPGDRYRITGQVMIPSGGTQSLGNAARIGWWMTSDANCTTGIGGPQSSGSPGAFDTWTQVPPVSIQAPPGASALKVRLLVTKIPAGGSARAHFDNLSVIPEHVFDDGFEP
jgi:hypothetical protein